MYFQFILVLCVPFHAICNLQSTCHIAEHLNMRVENFFGRLCLPIYLFIKLFIQLYLYTGKTSVLKVNTEIALITLLKYQSNDSVNLITRKIITVGKCLLSMNVVWLINLFIIKKETPAAGFKTSEGLCVPHIGRPSQLFHSTAPP